MEGSSMRFSLKTIDLRVITPLALREGQGGESSREAVNHGLHVFLSWILNELTLHGVEAEGIEPFHTGTP